MIPVAVSWSPALTRVFATRPAGNSPVVTANPIYFGTSSGAGAAADGDTDLTIAA